MDFTNYMSNLWKSQGIERFKYVRIFYEYLYWILNLIFPVFHISIIIDINIFKVPIYESVEKYLHQPIITPELLSIAYLYLYFFPRNKYNNVKIFKKYKKGDHKLPQNYRYIMDHSYVVKTVDRILLSLLAEWFNNKELLVDRDIFKNPIFKNENILKTREIANVNTLSTNGIVLLDLKNAYDNVEWYLIKNLLYNNLKRKLGRIKAYYYVSKYMLTLYNRKLYFKKSQIEVSRGIPQGLPSSCAVFTFIMDEIIYLWKKKSIYKYGVDYLLNIYVDDIYIKILNLPNCKNIIFDLIHHFEKYNFTMNFDKCKADSSISSILSFQPIKESDTYLGIPFTRDLKLYLHIVLNEFYRKHDIYLYPCAILHILKSNNSDLKKTTYGFFNYKLYPLIKLYNVNNLVELLERISNLGI